MRTREIMTSPVTTASPDMSIQDAAQLLADNRISGMPVVDVSGNVIGIISEGDLIHRVETGTDADRRHWWQGWLASTRKLAERYVKEHGRRVSDAMSEPAISIDENASLSDVADVLERRRIKRLPVLRDGKLVGIVSRSDLIRELASMKPDRAADAVYEDATIREAVFTALDSKRWALPWGGVVVKHGIVQLWGVVDSEEERRATCVTAESVKGVKRVESYLVCISRNSR
jgi:CBS domain-containing protein